VVNLIINNFWQLVNLSDLKEGEIVKNLIKLFVILTMLMMMFGCEEEVPDYAADIVGKYIIESIYSSFWDETIDLTVLPLESALLVEINLNDMITYENDENQCLDTYTMQTDEIDGVTETSIQFTDNTDVVYGMVGGKLRIENGNDVFMLAAYSGDIPPASWTDPTLLTNDTYEPNNEVTMATAIAAGGTTQNHYLGNCGDLDYFMFSAISGTNYILETTSPLNEELDLKLTLYSASGLEIDSDDDDGANWNPSLYWTCQTSGDYYFLIEGYSDEEVGYYSVSVSASTTLQKTPSASIEKKHRLVEKIRLSDLFFD